MIVKFFELNNKNLSKNKIFLFYGKNDGLKKETISNIIGKNIKILNYEEKEILANQENFIESFSTKSLFEEEKIILIKRTSDKILKIIEKLIEIEITEPIILDAESLEKKSKLRSFFEKHKQFLCTPFYPDTDVTLQNFASNFFKKKDIFVSSENVNFIINKVNGDRGILLNELEKIEQYSKHQKKITRENITKLINLTENHNISELIDFCLTKNQKKTINILNENNFSNEDAILIIRVFLNKAKNILKLSNEYEKNHNIDLTISTAKPPIFWKDKQIIKDQIYKWKPGSIKKLIYSLSELELNVKKNINNSINTISNFLLEKSSTKTNN